jgi:CubicO group peptidase (beta-lactamase class C family)
VRRGQWRGRLVLAAAVVAGAWTIGPGAALAPFGGLARAQSALRQLARVTPESAGVSAERLRRLDAGMQRIVDEGQLAGVVTLMARHGQLVNVSVYGKKDIRKPDPIQRDSIFRIFSMTKPVVALAMMMLYEEGRWRLNDPVTMYIPEFANMKVYTGRNADGTPQLEDARRPMTMRELMTHSGGLGYTLNPNNPVDRMIIDARLLDSSKPLQAMIEALAKVPLQSQPGTRWYYSIASDVQGHLVEKLSGQSLADFFQSRIFGPLGMKDTAFFVPREKLGRLARIHTTDRGTLQPPADDSVDVTVPPKGASGGGGLYSTGDDYLRFAQMLLDEGAFNGARLVAPRTVQMMRTNHLLDEPLGTMAPGYGWGLGFRVVMDAARTGEPWADGSYYWFGIAGTWFWIDPKTDLVFVGMIQQRGGDYTRAQNLSHNLAYQAVVD